MLKADGGFSLTLVGADAHIAKTAINLLQQSGALKASKQQCQTGDGKGVPALVMQARDACSVCSLRCRLWHISCWRSA